MNHARVLHHRLEKEAPIYGAIMALRRAGYRVARRDEETSWVSRRRFVRRVATYTELPRLAQELLPS